MEHEVLNLKLTWLLYSIFTKKSIVKHQHINKWHYFKNQIQKENGKYNVTVNVGETKNKNIIYEIKIKKI